MNFDAFHRFWFALLLCLFLLTGQLLGFFGPCLCLFGVSFRAFGRLPGVFFCCGLGIFCSLVGNMGEEERERERVSVWRAGGETAIMVWLRSIMLLHSATRSVMKWAGTQTPRAVNTHLSFRFQRLSRALPFPGLVPRHKNKN